MDAMNCETVRENENELTLAGHRGRQDAPSPLDALIEHLAALTSGG